MEQTKHKSAAKVLIVAVLTFVVTLAMVFAILPATTTAVLSVTSESTAYADGHTHDGVNFNPWNSGYDLPTSSGNYYLTTDVNIDYWDVENDVTIRLCLNGHTISVSGSIVVYESCTLAIYDENAGTGKIIAADEDTTTGLDIMDNATFYLYGGEISGFSEHGIEARSNVYLYGGKIANNSGRGVGIWDGSAVLHLSGTVFSGNTNGDIYLNYTQLIYIDGAMSGNVNIDINGGLRTFTSGWSTYMDGEDPADYFTPTNGTAVLNGAGEVMAANWSYSADGNVITAQCTEGCPLSDQTLTLSAIGKDYDGTAVVASYEVSVDWPGGEPEISYTGNTSVGTYTASVTVEGATATADFTIAPLAAVNYKTAAWTNNAVVLSDASTTQYLSVTDAATVWTNNTYVVGSDVTISDRIEVSGTVYLILCDGATLTAEKGIEVSSGNTLNVYAQSTGENMGAIVATGTGNAAAIGGGYGGTGGNVNIHGGVITATGDEGAAGIGGGDGGDGGNVNIYGGIITATGDEHAGGGSGGAGIGGGEYGNGGNVNIYGGVITATGGEGAAGIGCGDAGSSNGALTVAEGYVVYGGTSADPTTVIEKSDNDYARYQYMIVTVPHYVLAYSANGATGDVPTDENSPYEEGSTVTVLGNTGNLVNGSFTFVGWNTEANGTGISYGAGDTFTITEDITLYAQWRSVKVIVTNGDSAFVLNDGVTYNVGDTYSFTRDGDSETEEISKVYNNCGNALTGAMTNYDDYDNEAPWHEDDTAQYSIRYVVIGSGITHVGNYAFKDCGMLKYVTFSEGLVSIGAGAFCRSNAAWEKALCFPDSLTTIGANAFDTSKMKIIKFGTGLTTIGARAFYNCDNLVVGGQDVSTDIDDYYSDYPYEAIDEDQIVLTLPAGLTTIGESAFCDCAGLKKVIIPSSVNDMGSSVFCDCENISSVNWNTEITRIPSSTFEGCSALTGFTIPSCVTEIGSYAFEESGLTSITIPSTVETVGDQTFAGCGNLATVVFASKDTSINSYAFNGVGSTEARTLTLPADWDQSDLPAIADGAWRGGYFTLSSKFDSSVATAPAAVANLSYTGSAQTLITAGTASGGTMYYKVGHGEYATTLPQATNAGTYTVYYKVVGDTNHNDSAEDSLEVTIGATASTGRELGSAYLDGTDPDVIVDSNNGGMQETPGGVSGDWSWYGYTSVERSSYNGTDTALFTGSSINFQYKNTSGLKIRSVEIVVSDCYNYNIFAYGPNDTKSSQTKVRNGENETIRLIFDNTGEGVVTISFVNQAVGVNTFHLVGIHIYAIPHDVFTFDKNGGEGGDDSVICYQADIAPTITPPTKDGYVFDGYYDENYETRYFKATGGYKSFMYNTLEGDKTLYAKWLPIMTVSANDYIGVYDGDPHTITVTVTNPSERLYHHVQCRRKRIRQHASRVH